MSVAGLRVRSEHVLPEILKLRVRSLRLCTHPREHWHGDSFFLWRGVRRSVRRGLAWNRQVSWTPSRQAELRLPQSYVSRWRWLRDRQGQAIVSCGKYLPSTRRSRRGSQQLAVAISAHQAASNSPGRAGWGQRLSSGPGTTGPK